MSASRAILITGGTGSFGKTMLRHLLAAGCSEIRVLSRDEEKQDTLRNELQDQRIRYYIGDVRDRASVDNAMRGVEHVFHAAALKQVPSCEFFPVEAIRTNTLGSANVIESAVANGVRSVICLSTDKAAFPINAMGMTKALMEKIVQSIARRLEADRGQTIVSSVRYGNVMCSRGSVIPLFIRQIREGLPITITEPTMTRFMMPLRDSVALVNFAFTQAQQGDLFVKKARACTIGDLVTALKNLFRASNEVRVIGIRHAEKLHETLATREEVRRAQDMGPYFRIPLDARDLNYNAYFTAGDTQEIEHDDYTSNNALQLTVRETEELLLSLPEVAEQLRQHLARVQRIEA
jgi:UDP-N-acetylglucosamine 4,6-dehydratase